MATATFFCNKDYKCTAEGRIDAPVNSLELLLFSPPELLSFRQESNQSAAKRGKPAGGFPLLELPFRQRAARLLIAAKFRRLNFSHAYYDLRRELNMIFTRFVFAADFFYAEFNGYYKCYSFSLYNKNFSPSATLAYMKLLEFSSLKTKLSPSSLK